VSGDGGRPRAWFGRVEIPAADPRAAAVFYRRVFGWTAGEAAEAGAAAPYLSLRTAPGGCGAGVTTAEVLGAAQPLAVVHVEGEALAAVLARVTAAGGVVDLPPAPVGGHGTFARFRDPDGNLLGLWSVKDSRND
jgi:uncharacterized protein